MYNLKQKDFDFLNNLVKITISIESCYQKLYELEINGKKESEKYKEILSYIDLILEIEKEKYFSLNFEKTEALENFIINERLSENFNFNIEEDIINNQLEDKIYRRILHNLEKIKISNKDILKEKVAKNIAKKNNVKDIKNFNFIYNSLNFVSLDISYELENDLLKAFLIFINEYLNSENKTFLNLLIKLKYDISFVNNSIEWDMLENNFDINNLYCFNAIHLANLMKVKFAILDYIKNGYLNDIAYDQILELLEITDEEYRDPYVCFTSMLRKFFLTASLSLVSYNSGEDIYDDIIDIVEEKEEEGDANISNAIVINAFYHIRENKRKCGLILK